jgi:hypothetical protein
MNDETLLLRQVHPSFVQGDRITSQVFTPRTQGGNRLSVYDGDQIEPETSWRHYTARLRHASTGVMAVSVLECTRQGLQAYPDPTDFPEHAVIDFGQMQGGKVKATAKRLRTAAADRGWLYREEGQP